MPSAPLDPLEAEPPVVELVDPTPAASRYPVRDTAPTTRLSREEIDNLLTATSEAVATPSSTGDRR